MKGNKNYNDRVASPGNVPIHFKYEKESTYFEMAAEQILKLLNKLKLYTFFWLTAPIKRINFVWLTIKWKKSF